MISAARVLLFAAVSPLLLRAVKLERLGAWLEPARAAAKPAGAPGAPEEVVRRVDRLIQLGWPLVRRGCLVRGMTLYRFLREAGFEAALCFGMGQPEGLSEGDSGLTGHCWIELDRQPLAEKRDPRPIYTETFRIAPRVAAAEERSRALA